MAWLVIIFETFPFLLSLFAIILVFEKIVIALKKGDAFLCLLLFLLLIFSVLALLYFLFYLAISLKTKIDYDEKRKNERKN
jgi:hypothetical protein